MKKSFLLQIESDTRTRQVVSEEDLVAYLEQASLMAIRQATAGALPAVTVENVTHFVKNITAQCDQRDAQLKRLRLELHQLEEKFKPLKLK